MLCTLTCPRLNFRGGTTISSDTGCFYCSPAAAAMQASFVSLCVVLLICSRSQPWRGTRSHFVGASKHCMFRNFNVSHKTCLNIIKKRKQ